MTSAQQDSARRLIRIFGPPGTGKTTELARRVKIDVRNLGPESTLIASFTNTAAHEIGSRGLGLAKGYCGTLHSHAYRVCGHPAVALDTKIIEDWNDSAPGDWKISAASKGGALASTDKVTPGARATTPDQAQTGDELLAALDLLRARATPPAEWPSNVRAFAKRWTAWKDSIEAYDFSDMIVQAYHRARDGEGPPGKPKRFILDEAQDCTPIEIALAMVWAEHVDTTVFAFDDDQAINQWRGGDPARLLDLVDGPAPGDMTVSTEVLAQSYRVPPAVHALAQRWIATCSRRYAKEYRPRAADAQRGDRTEADAHGYAYRVGYDLADPRLLDAVEADLADGETPMVLATCGYMLLPLIRGLRDRGIPFHNPFRPSDGQWNPLGTEGNGVATAERVYSYLVADRTAMGEDFRRWTGEDMSKWVELVSTPRAGMVRGAGKIVDGLPRGEVPWDLVSSLWKPGPPDEHGQPTASDDLARAVAPDLEWFAANLVPSNVGKATYPIQVARTRGPGALRPGAPRVVLGTVHSVKGATASKVYLSPDLSAAGMRQWTSPDPLLRDQIIRLFYVGATRAFRSLMLLAPGSPYSVETGALLPPDLEVRP